MKAYKTEIKLSKEQKEKYFQSIGTCRFLYNLFIETNQRIYKENGGSFVNAHYFSIYLNNKYLFQNPDKFWIKDTSSKAIKKIIQNAEKAYKKFFKKMAEFPRWKKRNVNECSFYFTRSSASQPIFCERHKIKIPTFGWVRLKEYGYLPTECNKIISGTITHRAGKFFISVLTDDEFTPSYKDNPCSPGIGLDLGIQNMVILSNGKTYANINKKRKIRKRTKRLKREQRKFAKRLARVKKLSKKSKNKKEISTANLDKQRIKIQKIYMQLQNQRIDWENKIINNLVRTKPEFITIEDLNISGMMKNKRIARAISEMRWYSFITKLKNKCVVENIELRIADRFFPSSKTCSVCGWKNDNLKLSNRTFVCGKCGATMDRDHNAAINLRKCDKYIIYTNEKISTVAIDSYNRGNLRPRSVITNNA